jgi:hypothetical protein
MSKEPAKGNSAVIIVAIVGALSTILAASIGAITTYNVEKMRQEAELTQIALISKSTQSGATQAILQTTVNAPTPSPYPTYTLQPTTEKVTVVTATQQPPTNTPSEPILPFKDNFDNGLNSAWRITYGTPFFTNGSLGAIDESVTIEFGNETLQNFVLEFDCSEFNNERGVEVQFTEVSYWMDYYTIKWYYLNQGWQQFYRTDIPRTFVNGHLKFVVVGNKYSVYKNGEPLNEIVQGNPHSGSIKIKVSKNAYIDNLSIYAP